MWVAFVGWARMHVSGACHGVGAFGPALHCFVRGPGLLDSPRFWIFYASRAVNEREFRGDFLTRGAAVDVLLYPLKIAFGPFKVAAVVDSHWHQCRGRLDRVP